MMGLLIHNFLKYISPTMSRFYIYILLRITCFISGAFSMLLKDYIKRIHPINIRLVKAKFVWRYVGTAIA